LSKLSSAVAIKVEYSYIIRLNPTEAEGVMESQRFCRECERPLSGRRDKKFCDEYCKSAFHYKKDREGNNFYLQVAQQLKMNRKLLKAYNKAGKATVRAEILLAQGFQPKFFTHYWK